MATDHNFKVKNGLDVLGGTASISGGHLTLTSNSYGVNTRSVLARDVNGLNLGTSNGTTALSIDNSGNVSMPYNLTVTGNLTVNGTTLTVDTTNLQVQDNNITLNYSTGDSSSSANGAGITIQDAVNSSTDATILWSQAGGNFNVSHGWNSLGYLQHSGVLYSRNNLLVLNSAGNGWNTWATRSGGQFNLSVGTIASGAITSTGSITGTYFLASGADSTPAGTGFSNVFKGSNARTVYFDSGDGSSISTWYGSGNTPFAAIDANNGILRLYVNDTSGNWNERIQMNSSGITHYGTTTVISNNVHLDSTGSAYYRADGATNSWKYLSLQTNGSTSWDIATKNDDLSGALQFRPGGGPTNRTSMSTAGDWTFDGRITVGDTAETQKVVLNFDSGGNMILGNDGSYGPTGNGRYTTLGFGGTTNGVNRIFAHNGTADGLYLAAATGAKVKVRANGLGSDTFALGIDDSYSGYASLGFGGGLQNGYNRIFASTGNSDGMYINAATGRGIFFRVNGNGSNVFQIKSDGGLYVGASAGTLVLDQSRNLTNIGTITNSGKISSSIGSNATYSRPLLEITSSGTPTQIKITTNIPYSGSGASTHAHSVTIRGFQYGSSQMADLQIGWHVYLNQFYNRSVTSSGSWAPTVTLAVENNKVVIHLASPGYWPKLYVESMYNAYGGAGQASGWSWSDAAISADANTPNVTVPYKFDYGNGVLMSGGTTIINSSRNLSNIGTISSGAITSTGNVEGASLETNHTITFGYNSHYLQAGTGSLFFKNNSNASLGGIDASGFNTPYGYQIAGTTVINSSRSVNNVTLGALATGARFEHNNWHQSSDGYNRFYFANASHTYFRTGSAYVFRDNGDTGRATISAHGGVNLLSGGDGHVASNVALAVGGTTVIDSSRNLTNIGTIASGAITANGGGNQSVIKSSSDAPLIVESTDAYSGINFKDTGGNSSMFYHGSSDHLYLHSAKFSVAGSTLASGYQFQVNGSANLTGSLAIGGAQVIAASTRNLTNIGTISSGAITSTGNMSLTGSLDITKSGSTHSLVLGTLDDLVNPSADAYIWVTSGVGSVGTFKYGQGAHLVFEGRRSARNFYFKVGDVTAPQHIMHSNGYVGFGTGDITPTDRVHVDGHVRASSYKIGTTTVISSSRNLTNIGTISSGAITSSGAVTAPEGIFGSTSGNNQGIQIKSGTGSGDYGRIRYYEGATTQRNTIHFFGRTWQSGSLAGHGTGSINLDGDYGVTFGAWNNIDAYIDGNGFHTGSGRGYYVGSQNVIDSSRNLVNIGTIGSSGQHSITGGSTGSILLKIGSATQTEYVDFQMASNSGVGELFKNGTAYTGYGGASSFNMYNSNGLLAFHPGGATNVLQIDSTGLNVGASRTIRMNGTTVIDSSRNLTNIGTISSGAITSSGNSVFTGGNSDGTGNAFEIKRGGNSQQQAIRVQNTGEVVVSNNYLYAAHTGTSFYSQGDAVFRATIRNDTSGMPVKVSDDFNVTGDIQSNGTVILQASGRNLTNIGTISSGATTVNGILTVGGTSVGSEGGEIRFTQGSGASSLSGNEVVFDQAGNTLRFFESAGNTRGAYIDINTCQNGATSKIWHSGNDGTGSGLDADTVDSIEANRIVYGTDTSKVYRWNGDWDTMFATVNTGFFDNSSGTNGNPDGFTHHHGFQVRHNNMTNEWGYQFMGSYHPSYQSLYHRSVSAGTWSSWKEIWDSGNDGSGSGLDADLLDGLDLHTGRNNEVNKVVRTDSNGYIQAGWINTTSGNEGTATFDRIYASYDGYIRYYTPANFGAQISSHINYNNLSNKPTIPTNNNQLTNGAGYITTSGTASQSHAVTGSAFATTASPGSVLEYQQAASQTDTRLAPSTSWHNTIRMGHGNPYNYYSNTLAMQMTGTGAGQIKTQLISNNVAQGWRTVWDSTNDGAGSGLHADLLDGQHGSYYYSSANYPPQTSFENTHNNLSSNTGSGANLNSTFTGAAKSGNFDVWSGSNMPPSTTHVQGVQVRHSTTTHYGWQLASQYNQPGKMYLRNVSNSTFFDWHTMWSSANDGPGSGLDADTVDGIEAASTIHKFSNTGYYRPDTWIDFQSSNGAGLYWAANTGAGWHIHPTSTAIMRMRSGSTTQTFLELNTTGTARGYVYANNSNDVGFLNEAQSWRLRVQSAGSVYMGGTQQMRINSSSTTAIVEGSSTYLVFRNTGSGAISFQKSGGTALGEFTNSGNLNVLGNVTAYGSPSDINLKENIETISNAIEKVQKLDGVTFNYKKDGGRSTGLIAQQLQEVLPEVVYTSEGIDGEEHLAVRYGNTVGLLVEAIKELKQEINELKAQLKEK